MHPFAQGSGASAKNHVYASHCGLLLQSASHSAAELLRPSDTYPPCCLPAAGSLSMLLKTFSSWARRTNNGTDEGTIVS